MGEKYRIISKKLLNTGLLMAIKFKKWPIIWRDLSVIASNKCQKKEKMFKIILIICQKGLNNNSQFKLKSYDSRFRRKQKNKIILIKGPKSRKNTR